MTRAKGKRQAVILNVWGTPREWINADEFCPDCERETPWHYANCPTRSAYVVVEGNGWRGGYLRPLTD